MSCKKTNSGKETQFLRVVPPEKDSARERVVEEFLNIINALEPVLRPCVGSPAPANVSAAAPVSSRKRFQKQLFPMKKLFLLSILLLATATAFAQAPTFVDDAQHYEFMDGKTIIKMNCNGIATVKNQQNDFGRHYETVLYVTNSKKENYFQGIIHKDSWKQVSAKRTSRSTYSHYVWQEDKIIEYDMTNDFMADYGNNKKNYIDNNNTVDLCGLIYLLRCGITAQTLGTETILIDKKILHLSNIELIEDMDTRTFKIKVGQEYHISCRIRKDEDSTPEYLDINIPGFTTKASLVEHGNRIALR